VVEPGASHKRKVNGILGLLCRTHYPGLVTHHSIEEPAYTFHHYYVAADLPDREGRCFPNKAERVVAELWVCLSCSTFVSISLSFHILDNNH